MLEIYIYIKSITRIRYTNLVTFRNWCELCLLLLFQRTHFPEHKFVITFFFHSMLEIKNSNKKEKIQFKTVKPV